ncbi:MAG: T9SS type A sorting domain-containing protein [Lutibacter sp.]|uniref:hypothetical protein n=1 Tax=Lutibacter sp. TaxID=1925666 RepID=UPI00385C8D6A
MKKSLSLLILVCCFSVTVFSLNINSTITKVEKSIFQNLDTDDVRPKFRIGFNAPQIDHRQLLLTIDENATDGVDWGYDAQLYQVLNDDMYWIINNTKYVIQATNYITIDKEFNLGIITSNGGDITIGIDAIENPIEGFKVCLKDKELNIIYDIQEVDYQITLAAGEYHNRYALVFVSTQSSIDEDDLGLDLDIINEGEGEDSSVNEINETIKNEALKHQFKMYIVNGSNTLTIRNKEFIKVNNLVLYNKLGQVTQVWSTNLNQEQFCLSVNVKKGVYIIQAITEIGNISKRVVINNL